MNPLLLLATLMVPSTLAISAGAPIADLLPGWHSDDEVQSPQRKVEDPFQAERLARLTAYSHAMNAYFAQTCQLTDQQQQELAQASTQAIERLQDHWAANQAPNRRRSSKDFGPYDFASRGAGQLLRQDSEWQRALESTLTDAQKQTLQRNRQQRKQRQRAGIVDSLMDQLIERLYMNPQQQARLRQYLIDHLGDEVLLGLLSLSESHSMHQPYSVASVLKDDAIAQILDDPRQRVLNDLLVTDRMCWFESGNFTQWETQKQSSLEDYERRLMNVVEARLALLQDEHTLDATQLRRLRIAGKGSVASKLKEWRRTVDQRLDRWRERPQNPNTKYGFQLPDGFGVLRDSRWQKTLERTLAAVTPVAPEAAKAAQSKRRLRATVDHMVAVVDQEVWLSESQLEQLAALIEPVLPSSLVRNSQSQLREIYLLSHVVHLIEDDQLNQVLGPVQLAAWQQLRNQYPLQDNQIRFEFARGSAAWSLRRN